MEFRLIYEGPLVATQRDPTDDQRDPRRMEKHTLRQRFHPQLRRLWKEHPVLKKKTEEGKIGGRPIWEVIAERNKKYGYRYVPLVRSSKSLLCSLNILFLRRDTPGHLLDSGDIDNRIKTLIDGLRLPMHQNEMNGIPGPNGDEDPFFVLLEDDDLVSHLSVETDMLLDPVGLLKQDKENVRLVISVKIRPYDVNLGNLSYV